MNQDDISPDSAIEVHQVANGFLVRVPYIFSRGNQQPTETAFVFESFEGLAAWLEVHFSHRNTRVASDK